MVKGLENKSYEDWLSKLECLVCRTGGWGETLPLSGTAWK